MLLFGALAVFLVLAVATALAAVGDLTPQGCIDDNDSGGDACATSGDGLGGGVSPAVSPDGRSVYGISFSDDSIVRFDRDTTTGALTYQGCIDDNDEGPDSCATATDGLNGAIEVDVSPDGSSVYVVTDGDAAIVTFNRAAGGALTPAGCIEDDDTGADAACPKISALGGAGAVEVSPDGKSVYVTSFSDDAIVRFDRAGGGALTAQGCIDDNDFSADTCAVSADGLDNAIGVAVTPDNRSVYVAANGDDALARFDRDPATGALTAQGCLGDNDSGSDTGCSNTADGLDGIFHVVSSPGGATIYTSAQQDQAVSRFDRNTSGALTVSGCVDDNDTGPDACVASTDGLAGAGWSDVSADGRSLYAGAGGDSAIVTFGRESEPIVGPGPGPTSDTDPPQTSITKKPKKKAKKPVTTFRFKSDEAGSRFQCKLTGKGVKKKLKKYRPCNSRKKIYRKLKNGKKQFLVRATDAAGNVDPTPAKYKWKVIRPRPKN